MTDSNQSKQRKLASKIATSLVVLSFIILAVLGLRELFKTKEEHTSRTAAETTISWVECKTESPQDGFFEVPASALDNSHQLKITYQGDLVKEIFYDYTSGYANPDDATAAESDHHAKYNNYMRDAATDLSNHFAANGDQLKINLLVQSNQLNAGVAKLFFITPEEYPEIEDNHIDKLVEIYQRKGFSCKYGG